MQNPFTTTFSKTPEYTYIETEGSREIIENFSYESPSEAVYKITGVRGSGKTVILAKVEEAYKTEENRKNGWIVCRLSPARDMLQQFAALLHKENIIKEKPQSLSISVSANILGTGGGIGYAASENNHFFDIGVEISEMLSICAGNGQKILIGIDEVSRTPEMIAFASEFGTWLRAGYPVYMVCTGLYENIQELSNVKNLTFFRRASTIKTGPLNMVRMSETYKSKLQIDSEMAKELAAVTRGYAYAFQELGVLYFKKSNEETLDDILQSLKTELFSYSYEKIWEELSEEDRRLARTLKDKPEYKREEILAELGAKSANYSVYRDRLFKRGIITIRRAHISLALPYFGEYIKEYGLFS